MLNADQALEKILASVSPLSPIRVGLQRSIGRALASDMVAPANVPAFANSGMDGYAVRAEDVANPPVHLKFIGEIQAGSVFQGSIVQGTAAAIMTGARIPEGCSCVIQQEWTERKDDSSVTILRSAGNGHNIRPEGGDIRKGTVALGAGSVIRPQEIGVLASMGIQFVTVRRKPLAAILATGNELVEIDKPLADGRVYNSNAHALVAMAGEAGAEASSLGIAADDAASVDEKIMAGLRSDILITSGGISVGKYDLVMKSLIDAGVDVQFWKVNIKPGMPILFGMRGTTAVFALPGNPVSTLVTFLQFVKPAIMKMSGAATWKPPLFKATIEHDVKKTDGKKHFIRGVLKHHHGVLSVRSTGSQTSNELSSMVRANCLIVLPEDRTDVRTGEWVEVELI